MYSCCTLKNGQTALDKFPYTGRPDIRPALRSFIASTWHTTPIHQLCYENDTAGLQALLDSRSDSVLEILSLQNERGWTALHVAVFMNRVEVIKVLASFGVGFLEIINIPGNI